MGSHKKMIRKIIILSFTFFIVFNAWSQWRSYRDHHGPMWVFVAREKENVVFYVDYWELRKIDEKDWEESGVFPNGVEELYMELVSNKMKISIPVYDIEEIRINRDEPEFYK